MTCKICSNKKTKTIYNDFIRVGSFGKKSSKKYSVFICEKCKAKFINDTLPIDYYEEATYRQDYNESTLVSNFYKEHDFIDTNKLTKIGLDKLRDKIVCEFGTGAGTFLQVISNISKYTIAVEPSKHFHKSLSKTNKFVFSYGKDLLESKEKIDVATSFDVIEHVSSPVNYLKEIYQCLNENGTLYLKTPNFHDIIHELNSENFDSFNYRTAHIFYFCKDSIDYVLKEAGFKKYKIDFIHDYDISNLLYWLKESRPTGLKKTDLFDEEFNLLYKKYLERVGKASHLWIEATK